MVSSGLINRVDVSHFRLSLHLIIAFIILSLILWNYLKLNENKNNKIKINNFYPYIFLILIFIQITIGAFVSGMDAGLIYNTWPLMGENYFPDDNRISNLFHISVFNNASLVQFIHRNLAYVILLFYILILLDVYRNRIKTSLYPIILLGIFLISQIILGILTLVNGVHIILASLHQVSSIFLISSSVYLLFLNKKNKI